MGLKSHNEERQPATLLSPLAGTGREEAKRQPDSNTSQVPVLMSNSVSPSLPSQALCTLSTLLCAPVLPEGLLHPLVPVAAIVMRGSRLASATQGRGKDAAAAAAAREGGKENAAAASLLPPASM